MLREKITDLTKWLRMQVIPIREHGIRFTVINVGVSAVDLAEITGTDAEGGLVVGGKIPLPFICVALDGEKRFFRLPIELQEWAVTCVSQKIPGLFPDEVEIGLNDLGIYAKHSPKLRGPVLRGGVPKDIFICSAGHINFIDEVNATTVITCPNCGKKFQAYMSAYRSFDIKEI